MSGGEISGNTGGVSNSGRFVMSNGIISGNIGEYGGGVSTSGTIGTFIMTGGKISGNTATKGGGVYINYGEFTMSGGEISGNKAKDDGGGVYIYPTSKFTMSGGKISGNTAKDDGGGVYNHYTFVMSGGTITHNTATYGGGVYTPLNYSPPATFEWISGVVSGNIASEGKNVYPNSSQCHFHKVGLCAKNGILPSMGDKNGTYQQNN